MEKELPKEEVKRRARELARRVMASPPQRQEWPKQKPTKSRGVASKPRKRAQAGAAS